MIYMTFPQYTGRSGDVLTARLSLDRAIGRDGIQDGSSMPWCSE